jgi:hypothetical protein
MMPTYAIMWIIMALKQTKVGLNVNRKRLRKQEECKPNDIVLFRRFFLWRRRCNVLAYKHDDETIMQCL